MLLFRNILIKNKSLKIADFGMSKFLISTGTICKAGTPLYQSPEIHLHQRFDLSSDVW